MLIWNHQTEEGGLLLDKTANHFFFFARRKGKDAETSVEVETCSFC